jgi:hypothetical protein
MSTEVLTIQPFENKATEEEIEYSGEIPDDFDNFCDWLDQFPSLLVMVYEESRKIIIRCDYAEITLMQQHGRYFHYLLVRFAQHYSTDNIDFDIIYN